MEDWGYTRYGRTANVDFIKNYELEWEDMTGVKDYNPDTFGLKRTIRALSNILSGDPRVECYRYTCDCHGDGSSNNIRIVHYFTSPEYRRAELDAIPANTNGYYQVEEYYSESVEAYAYKMCQTPAYFMQLLAAVMAGKLDGIDFATNSGYEVAKRYEYAKLQIALSYLGGIEHPHFLETYYVLADNIEASDFN